MGHISSMNIPFLNIPFICFAAWLVQFIVQIDPCVGKERTIEVSWTTQQVQFCKINFFV